MKCHEFINVYKKLVIKLSRHLFRMGQTESNREDGWAWSIQRESVRGKQLIGCGNWMFATGKVWSAKASCDKDCKASHHSRTLLTIARLGMYVDCGRELYPWCASMAVWWCPRAPTARCLGTQAAGRWCQALGMAVVSRHLLIDTCP